MMRRNCAIACLFLMLGLPLSAQKIYWSDGDGGSGTIDSAGWNDIQTALTNAQDGATTVGEVKLSGDFQRTKGDATVGNLTIAGGNVTVSGGWSTDLLSQTGKSLLDANGENTANNQYRVLTITGTNVTVSDLWLTGGFVYGGSAGSGGGITVNAGFVTLSNLIVSNNTAYGNYDNAGGGVSVINAADVTITRCVIVNNYGALNAGGIYIASNAGRYGNPVLVEYCDIRGNRTPASGGGVFIGESGSGVYSRALVSTCRITGNQADSGAGFYAGSFSETASQQVFFNCLIQGNRNYSATSLGMGVYKGNRTRAHVVNCTVTDNINTADSAKPGVYVGTGSWGVDSYLRFANSIVSDNNGCYVYAMNVSYGGAGAHMELQRTTIDEGTYARQHNGDVLLTTNSLVGALSFSPLPGHHSISDAGATTQLIEENKEDVPGFLNKGKYPYSLSGTSTSVDSALTRSGGSYTYVDINANGSYNALYDVIVAGIPPGGTHYVYTYDISVLDDALTGKDFSTSRPNRLREKGLDRGAYEYLSPAGTVVIFR